MLLCYCDDHVFIADAKNKRVQVLKVNGSAKEQLAMIEAELPVLDYESSIYTGEKIVDVDFVESKGLYSLSDNNGKILLKRKNEIA